MITVCSECLKDVGKDLKELNDQSDYFKRNPAKSDLREVITHTVVIHSNEQSIKNPQIRDALNSPISHLPIKVGNKDDSTTVITQWDMVLQKNVTTVAPETTIQPRKCSDCEKEFASQHGLSVHRKTDHSAGAFACLKCSFKVH